MVPSKFSLLFLSLILICLPSYSYAIPADVSCASRPDWDAFTLESITTVRGRYFSASALATIATYNSETEEYLKLNALINEFIHAYNFSYGSPEHMAIKEEIKRFIDNLVPKEKMRMEVWRHGKLIQTIYPDYSDYPGLALSYNDEFPAVFTGSFDYHSQTEHSYVPMRFNPPRRRSGLRLLPHDTVLAYFPSREEPVSAHCRKTGMDRRFLQKVKRGSPARVEAINTTDFENTVLTSIATNTSDGQTLEISGHISFKNIFEADELKRALRLVKAERLIDKLLTRAFNRKKFQLQLWNGSFLSARCPIRYSYSEWGYDASETGGHIGFAVSNDYTQSCRFSVKNGLMPYISEGSVLRLTSGNKEIKRATYKGCTNNCRGHLW